MSATSVHSTNVEMEIPDHLMNPEQEILWTHCHGKKILNMEIFESPDDAIPSKTLSYVNIRVGDSSRGAKNYRLKFSEDMGWLYTMLFQFRAKRDP
jgi:hypothetical protein